MRRSTVAASSVPQRIRQLTSRFSPFRQQFLDLELKRYRMGSVAAFERFFLPMYRSISMSPIAVILDCFSKEGSFSLFRLNLPGSVAAPGFHG
jgi:hypothetical protein